MENGRAGKVKKKKKEAEDMEQELLQEIASYWGTRAEGYSEVNEKELAGSQREAWLHVLEEQFPEKKKEEMKILDIGTGPGFFPMILSEAGYTVTAVDYTEEMLEKAKENLGKYTKYGLERVTLQRMDAQNLELYKENKMRAVITDTEVMGNENNLYFQFGGCQAVARVSKYEISQVGDEIEFVFMPSKIHFFDKETEVNYL